MTDAPGPILVLMYHRINDALPAGEWVVGTARFRKQMEYLAEKYEVVGIEELIRSRKVTKTQGYKEKQRVIVTFDDGYKDNYDNAYLVLKELELTATVFLTTGYIGTNKKRQRYQDTPWERDYLSWEEVREMARHGITFGAHTVNHVHLAQLGYEEQKQEIEESLGRAKDAASRKIFCYPYGEYNDDTLKILRELGVEVAFTTKPGLNDSSASLLELKRIGITGEDTIEDVSRKIRIAERNVDE